MTTGWAIAIAWAIEKGDIDDIREVPRCEHEGCGAFPRIDDTGDDDRRCSACKRSHRECEGCDDLGGETCIHCDHDFCESCWTKEPHHACLRRQAKEAKAA